MNLTLEAGPNLLGEGQMDRKTLVGAIRVAILPGRSQLESAIPGGGAGQKTR